MSCNNKGNDKLISKHSGAVSSVDREVKFGHRPITIWMTGLSASGKSKLAFALEKAFYGYDIKSFVLDGDNVRHGINKDLGFSELDRSENIRRVAEIASLMNDAGLVVITALISPGSKDRSLAKQIVGEDRFIEVYVNTPIETCEARDPKMLYKKARAGELGNFTGISSPYETPENPYLSVDTSNTSLDEAVKKLTATILPKLIIEKMKAKT
jgi:adenylylsulfate kinase